MVQVALAVFLLCPGNGDFVRVEGGSYWVGKEGHVDNPRRQVRLGTFEICKFETTNAQFECFVAATHYVTDAEKRHNAMVFEPGLPEFRWIKDPTAFWRLPNGRGRGDLKGKADHPVTTISFHDALEYCKWAKVRLPTLDEWEVASRAGSDKDQFFGDDPADISHYANVWHGRNHLEPDNSDGYHYTSPVGSFEPNPWGLYDIYGNVFEFCTGTVPGETSRTAGHARGGSWWCSKNSCCFFNSVDIGTANVRASFSNQGFRVVKPLTE